MAIVHEQIRINNTAQAGQFTAWAAMLGGLTTAGTVAGVLYHPLYFATVGAGVIGFIVLFWRIIEHDRRAFTVRSITDEPEPVTEEPLIQPVFHNADEGGRVIRYGKYAFTQYRWAELAKVLFQADNKFVRDVVSRANTFTNITKNWPEISRDFERLGLVYQGELTNDGIEWFSQFAPYPDK